MAVGSLSANDSAWDRAVLEEAGHLIDYLTIHNYGVCTGKSSDYEALAFTPVFFEQRLRKMLAVVDEFSNRRGDREPIRLSLDEWNIRHHRNGKLDRQDPRTQQDAVFVAGVLNTMIRLSPRVGMANYVFLVNGNGVMLVNRDQIVKTPLFHVFQQYGEWMRGTALNPAVESPLSDPPAPRAHYPEYKVPPDFQAPPSPYLDAPAALRDENTLTIALVNRHAEAEADVEIDLPPGFAPQTAWTLHHGDTFAANTFAEPNKVVPSIQTHPGNEVDLPPHSVSLILCRKVQ